MIFEAAIDRDLTVPEAAEVALLRRRDPAALGRMVERYQRRLYRYLIRLVKDSSAADDLFQQTWLHVVRQISSYDSRRSFDTWLFSIAHNAAMDLLRRRPGEPLEDDGRAYTAPEPDSLAEAMRAERSRIVAGVVAELPALYREALTLRFEEGMKLEEIAEVTRAPLSTVKSRVQRALESLRERMAPRWRKEDLL